MITLNQIYEELDFRNGALYEAAESPKGNRQLKDAWQEKGEWLSAAKRAGAEHVFFVDNNPVIVFTKIDSANLSDKIHALNNAWCLARPRLLFLESLGELTVLDLAKPPVAPSSDEDSLNEQWKKRHILLERTVQVSKRLHQFHRENIESGKIFFDEHFGELGQRADAALLQDLKTVRSVLIGQGLTATLAHTLIARSIFVRYLEDRNILTEKDFQSIARKASGRTDLLKKTIPGDQSDRTSYFINVLQDKEFTYDLFAYLADHFNGDMFPSDSDERRSVHKKHLKTVQNMLLGNIDAQRKLFFFAYDFDIIPLDLISSIYEEFYSLEKKEEQEVKKMNSQQRADGAYYTPSVLAEFVCSRVLSSETLKKKPRVLDPACGSGIFLVEAFRRIVRHRIASHPTKELDFDELKNIIKEQIAGIEANPEAARIAAFSLCLAMLHYLNPPDIRTQIYEKRNRLPCLLASTSRSGNHFHCILAENTFDVEKIDSSSIWKERFGNQSVDIIVGNPPWGSPGKDAPEESKRRHQVLLDWARDNGKPIGDREASQGFIWRTIDLLKPGGTCGMLVPASVLTKQGDPSRQFRKDCFTQIAIKEVFNFSHARHLFFQNSDSPFLFFSFCLKEKKQENGFIYWSVKASNQVEKIQSVTVSANDRFWVPMRLIENPTIWKTLLYGSLSDVDFINRLRNEYGRFEDFVAASGQGLKIASQAKDGSHLTKYPYLDIRSFSKYTALKWKQFPTKKLFEHLGFEPAYSGRRLLIKRGITEKTIPKGIIVSRYEETPFCFTHAIQGYILKENEEKNYKIFLGIFWSSLARYYFFNIASMWGTRNAEVHLHEILEFPVVFPKSQKQASEILRLVDNLRDYNPPVPSLLEAGVSRTAINAQRTQWEAELNEAVYDLYELNNQERDLISDCCQITIPYFYDPISSEGAQTIDDPQDGMLQDYSETFCRCWEPYLEDCTEMRWQGQLGAGGNMVAAQFFIVDKKLSTKNTPVYHSWDELLTSLENSTKHPLSSSLLIIEGMVHLLTEDGVIVIKRNEKRLWTKSKAREDAESTLCKSMMNDESSSKKGGR